MIRYKSQVSLSRPPADVFPYLVEQAKQALWSNVPMRPLTPGALRQGSRAELTFGKGPLKVTLGLELTAVEQDARIAFKSFSGPIDWQGEYLLAAADGGSTLSQTGTLTFHGLWRLLEPLIGAEMKGGEIKELERLKAVLAVS